MKIDSRCLTVPEGTETDFKNQDHKESGQVFIYNAISFVTLHHMTTYCPFTSKKDTWY